MPEGLREGTIRHIANQLGQPVRTVESRVNDLVSQGLSKDEVFRQLMNGNGTPKSHISGKPQDGTVEGIWTVSLRRHPHR